jgi:predicted AAA+ superfamily ATPase
MAYVRRLIDTRLEGLLTDVPAILLTGPRACGKTTTAQRYARTVVQLDDPVVGGVFREAPDVALRGLATPVLLDEWQAAPEIIGAVKRAVDRNPEPGQFILTGSASIDLAGPTWPGTGRIIRLAMFGLTEREIEANVDGPSFIDSVLDDPERLDVSTTLDMADYVERALRSGFPDPALRQRARTRVDWLDSYLGECFARDIPALRTVRDPSRLRRLFVALAANTAGVVEEKTLHEAARLDRKTALIYESLFEAVGLTEHAPSFVSNRLQRLIERPKRYITDCGLVGVALSLDSGAIVRL